MIRPFYSGVRCLLVFFVKDDAHPMYVVNHIRVADLMKDGYVQGVRQQQVIDFIHNAIEYFKVQILLIMETYSRVQNIILVMAELRVVMIRAM